MARIALFDAKPYDISSFEEANPGFGHHLAFHRAHLSSETLPLAQGHDAVCVFVNDVLDATVIEALHDYGHRIVALRCAGYNNVDLRAAFGKLHVVRVPAYSPYAIAEHTAALIFCLNRKVHKAYNRTREGNFSIDGLLGFDLHGKTLGVVGTGAVGRALIQGMRGFGMRVVAYDVKPDGRVAGELGFDYVELEELYRTSDIISLHCPLTRDNVHMINQQAIERMKDGVMIVNTGRGLLIDTRELIQGLKARKVGGAALDVYEEETEYFFEDFSGQVISDDLLARLLTFPNVLLTSHQGFFTREAISAIAQTTLANVTAFFTDGALPNEICYRCGASTCEKKAQGRCF